MKTHLSSPRPKQPRKTPISSLTLLRIGLLSSPSFWFPDNLHRIIWGRDQLTWSPSAARLAFLLAPRTPSAHDSLFSQTPAPLLCLCPTASIPPTHPYKPSTRNEAPSSLHPKYGHYLQYSSTSRMSSIKFCFGWMFKYFWSGHVSPSLWSNILIFRIALCHRLWGRSPNLFVFVIIFVSIFWNGRPIFPGMV